MPTHDWTKVDAGVFHDFHLGWVAAISRALNTGLSPPAMYAIIESREGDDATRVLPSEKREHPLVEDRLAISAIATPPRASVTRVTEGMCFYATRRRTIAVRCSRTDDLIASVEVAAPSNKQSVSAVRSFVDKAVSAANAGHHLVIVDLFPPRRHDPGGLCNVAFEAMGGEPFPLPPDRQLAVAAFRVEQPGLVHCYAEPLGVGAPPLPDVPLFIDADHYVNVPMESTYHAAWLATPKRWRDVIEPPAA